jgi:hypothetical protein
MTALEHHKASLKAAAYALRERIKRIDLRETALLVALASELRELDVEMRRLELPSCASSSRR